MQINNASSSSVFFEFQRINKEQRENCPLRLKYATGEIDHITPPQTGVHRVRAFEDDNIIILVASRNDPASAECSLSRITIICKRTNRAVSISDRELADKLYNKFMQMAGNNELSCTMEEFTEARRNLIKMLIFEWLFAMLYSAADEQSQTQNQTTHVKQTVAEAVVEEVIDSKMKDLVAEFLEKSGLQITCLELLNSIIDMVFKPTLQAKPDISFLSEEEIPQIEPKNPYQRIKDNPLYENYINEDHK